MKDGHGNGGAYYSTPDYNLWTRLMMWLFPQQALPLRDGDTRTYVITDVRVVADWLDRFRFLLTGSALIQVVTYTDVEVKEAQSIAAFAVQAGADRSQPKSGAQEER